MGAGGLSLAFFASVFWPGLTRSPVSALVGPIGWVWVHLPLFFLTSHNIHFMTQSAAKLDRTSVSSPVRARPPLAFASFLGGAARTSSALCFRWYFAILLWLFFIIGFYENIFRAINLTICQTPCTQLFHQPGGEEDVINPRPPLPTKKGTHTYWHRTPILFQHIKNFCLHLCYFRPLYTTHFARPLFIYPYTKQI